MKKTTIFKVLGLLLLIIVASCSKEESIMDSPDGQSNLKSALTPTNDALLPITGCNEITFKLVAGKDVINPAGTVNFTWDDDYLYVCFNTNSPWILDEVHFFVGLKEDVPLNSQGTPVPGHFPFYATGINAESYCYDPIPRSDIPDCPVILIHAVVVNPIALNNETAWAYGCKTFKDGFQTNRWGYFHDCYCFEDCEEPENKYLTFKSLLKNSSGQDFYTFLTDGDMNYSGSWCSDLGTVEPVDGAIYNLIEFGSANLIGEAVIDVDNITKEITLTLTLDDQTSSFYTTWLFYGTLDQLATYSATPGSCPNYPSFPYSNNTISYTQEITFPL